MWLMFIYSVELINTTLSGSLCSVHHISLMQYLKQIQWNWSKLCVLFVSMIVAKEAFHPDMII